jgi:tRNA (pseudouridine54-N1)-methyltransferase
MRRFIVIGHRAITTGDFKLDDLAGGTGRMDVLLRCINSSFFLSHDIRRDVEIILVLQGPPYPPKTIRLVGNELKYLNPDERSTAALIRNALLQKVDTEERSSPGIYISNRSYQDVLSNLPKEEQIVYLKETGANIRGFDFQDNVNFVLGDDQDLTGEEESLLLGYDPELISIGTKSYHADHCITIVNNELDLRGRNTASIPCNPEKV